MISIHLRDVVQAIRNRKPLPPFPNRISLEKGYNLQQKITRQINENKIIGWKAGVTNLQMQTAFGLSEPLMGSLYHSGQINSGDIIKTRPGQQIELEICVVVNSQGLPVSICPAIELVYLEFSEPKDLTPANAVAVNLGADRFLIGKPIPWNPDITDISIQLFKNGGSILKTVSQYSLGSFKDCVDWMIAQGQKHKMPISATGFHLMLLGTCGTALSAENGVYRAEFSQIGSIEFTIESEKNLAASV